MENPLKWLAMHAGMVDKYISAHAGTQNLFDIGKSGNGVKVSMCMLHHCIALHRTHDKLPAQFTCQMALKSHFQAAHINFA